MVTPAAEAWTGEGVGVVEAPRGTLLHHYRASHDGNITFANLIVATTQNNQVLNRTVRSVAEDYLGGRTEITEGMMNAIEVGLRAYDPCLSCATHAQTWAREFRIHCESCSAVIVLSVLVLEHRDATPRYSLNELLVDYGWLATSNGSYRREHAALARKNLRPRS